MTPARVYLSPGMFGFGRLASISYFGHVVTAIERRFGKQGQRVEVRVCEVHPTASIRRRAVTLARMIHETAADDGGPIHIVGHSTGGLDARLIASPTAHLPSLRKEQLAWLPRLRTITSMNTPHYGTPLAAFFATKSGQGLLYAISALTVTALRAGAPPLAAVSALVAAFGKPQLGRLELELVNRTTESLIRVLDDASSRELSAWLKLLREDQGAVVQLMPEAMDLFQAGVADREGVAYRSIASFAPPSRATDWLPTLRTPWAPMTATIFATLYNITARHDERYPCAPPEGATAKQLVAHLGSRPPVSANDGVVPLYSQVWGELLWAGQGDHLDVVGHFPGRGGHTDWLASGSAFSVERFEEVMDRLTAGMVSAEAKPEPRAL